MRNSPVLTREANSDSAAPPAIREAQVGDAVEAIDEAIHQRARLGIMSSLVALGEADFKLLKEMLRLTDGNLSTHLMLLEEKGYIRIHKEFRGKRPHTTALITEEGRAAFQRYLAALERLVQTSRGPV